MTTARRKRTVALIITLANTEREIRRCFPVMAQLRPHLGEDEFVAQIQRQIKTADYSLVFLEEKSRVRCVAGFRITECLHSGRYCYVDDLITDTSSRSAGHGGLLLDWIVEHARKSGCNALTLDSGVQRFRAHRFYLTKRMDIVAYHFSMKLR